MCVVPSTALLLKRTHSLTELYLIGCSIGEDAACQLAEGLRANSTPTQLFLYNNPLGQKGAQALVDSLAHNTSVDHLSLPEEYKDTIQSSVVYSRVSSRFSWLWLLVSLSFYMVLIYSYLCSLCMYMYTCMTWKYSCCIVWSWVMKISNTYIVTHIRHNIWMYMYMCECSSSKPAFQLEGPTFSFVVALIWAVEIQKSKCLHARISSLTKTPSTGAKVTGTAI